MDNGFCSSDTFFHEFIINRFLGSGGASVAITSAFDSDKTGYYMNDSINITVSGETDSGLTVTTKLELDGETVVDHTITEVLLSEMIA